MNLTNSCEIIFKNSLIAYENDLTYSNMTFRECDEYNRK
jgi:hypothetical protein